MDAQRGIARRMVIGLPREGLSPVWERDFSSFVPAGVILFGRDFADLDALRRLTRRLRELARPRRIFIGVDEEGGWVSQLGPHLVVPPNAALLARGGSEDDIEWAHRVTAQRLRALGLDWVFAPVADVASEPRNPVIGPRSFGSDPAAVSQAVGAALRGLAAGGVAACLKHFPGHGDTRTDSHHTLPVLDLDRATLERRELVPFAAHRGAPSVMSSHIVVNALDPERPGTFSKAVITGLLRGALGYGGVVVTDALEMEGAAQGRSPAERARLALEAGCDLVMFAFHDEAVRRARYELAEALVAGTLDRVSFDAARPRLAAFERTVPEPTDEDLARPIAALTPQGWTERLEAIAARGLIVRGAFPGGGLPLRVHEPAFAYGPTLASEFAALGARLETDPARPALDVHAVALRVTPPAELIERIRANARQGPVAVLGLQNDAFLDDLPEAALRISAADSTPLTRRVAARRLLELSRRA